MDRSDPVDALAAQQAELIALVDGLPAASLLSASRCDGWTVADVLLHLAQTNEMAVASVEGRLPAYVDAVAASIPAAGDIDAWAGALVDAERAEPGRSRDRYVASAASQLSAFEAVDPGRRVLWVAGEMAARTLATTRLTETWIHTVDVAVGLGTSPEPTDRLWHTCRLTWRTVPYALSRSGVDQLGTVAFDLTAPDGAEWVFGEVATADTIVTGLAVDLCTVAAQRGAAGDTTLRATGPDGDTVLRLMRTFA